MGVCFSRKDLHTHSPHLQLEEEYKSHLFCEQETLAQSVVERVEAWAKASSPPSELETVRQLGGACVFARICGCVCGENH